MITILDILELFSLIEDVVFSVYNLKTEEHIAYCITINDLEDDSILYYEVISIDNLYDDNPLCFNVEI